MYHNLCLGGGGIKLISFIGILKYISKENYINLNKLKNLYGVSAGAIICFLINIGYTIEEMEEFAINFNFKKLLPEINTENLLFFYGIGKSVKLKTLFLLLLKNKLNITTITFKELNIQTNINLNIGVTNLTNNSFEMWNYLTKPDICVIDALACSCNLPIVFEPIKIENNFYVDGGVTNNFPINYINKNDYIYTLGICCNNKKISNFNNIFEYLGQILSLSIDNNDNSRIENFNNKIDIINITSFENTLDFEINSETIKKRINYGYNFAKTFFFNKKFNKRRHSF